MYKSLIISIVQCIQVWPPRINYYYFEYVMLCIVCKWCSVLTKFILSKVELFFMFGNIYVLSYF